METIQIREVVARYRRPRKVSKSITKPECAAAFIRGLVQGEAREHFIVLHLDGEHKPCGYTVVAVGSANSCQINTREVFQSAILAGSVAVIIAHNHPSGSLIASDEDFKVTRLMKEAGQIVGVKVIDSMIVTDTAFSSLMQ